MLHHKRKRQTNLGGILTDNNHLLTNPTSFTMPDNPFVVLEEEYILCDTIGRGGFAKVKLAIHLITEEKVAIKIMEKSKLGNDLPRVKREISALKVLDHPHVCRLLQCIETETHIFMILEYCPGGELFDYIVERDRLNENEARRFFRQIVSAIAYVHSKGYAHRDLKPENLLLDDKQQIKLIDFGLCARPQGGMTEHLETCCGSPAYAAPELVSGKTYLGSEADIWSMGVLLFALLCGYLPFDDQNVFNLYRKIMKGYYTRPSFLSQESRALIGSMLQVIPSRRISVQELCKHPWLTRRFGKAVAWNQPNSRDTLDVDCLNSLANLQGINASQLALKIQEWNYDSVTATYLLLQQRKKRGLPLLKLLHRFDMSPNVSTSMEGGLDNTDLLTFCNKKSEEKKSEDECSKVTVKVQEPATPKKVPKTPILAIAAADPPHLTVGNIGDKENKFAYPSVPTPRKHRRIRSPKLGSVWSEVQGDTPSKLSPARSVDDNLHAVTPVRSLWSQEGGTSTSGNSTPLSARRMLGSLERGLNRMRNILTPMRRRNNDRPRILTTKGVCNVSTTASNSPEFVLNELLRALTKKGITCKQCGYMVQGKVKDGAGKTLLTFELEVCLVGPRLSVGIRRKRLRGDAWCYKRVCEEILAIAALQIPSTPEPELPVPCKTKLEDAVNKTTKQTSIPVK